jgi:hypothetical protein
MAKTTGSIKTGGRKKGTPNKRTEALRDLFAKKDFCVPERIIELLPTLEPAKQIDVLVQLMGYLFPKRKAIEQELHIEPEVAEPRLSRSELRTERARHFRFMSMCEEDPEVVACYKKLAEHTERLTDEMEDRMSW